MTPESEPIADDEWLLRWVRVERFRALPDGGLAVSPGGFEPRGVKSHAPDTTGISLFRLACLDRPEDCLAGLTEDKRPATGIVRVSVRLVRSLGLTVRSEPVETALGHVVIAELNADDFKTKGKAAFQNALFRLAEEASRPGNILIAPTAQ